MKKLICKKKPCRYNTKRVIELESVIRDYQNANSNLLAKLNAKSEDQSRSSQALQARTELIKALSWAMKTCSSIAWSDRKVFGQKP